MEAAAITEQIFKIAKMVYDQAKLVQANQAQCMRLAESISAVQSAIKKIGKIPDSEAYKQGLERLKTCLLKILKYMKELSGETWFRQFLNARSHQEQFIDFRQQLTDAVAQLNLGLSAQAILDREADQKAEREDHALLLKNQREIIRLNHALMRKIDQVPDEDFQRRQMAAMDSHFQALLQEIKEVKVLQGKTSLPRDTTSSVSSVILDSKIAIPYYELELEKKVAKGSFGTVYQGRWHGTGVAIKLWDGSLSEKEQQLFVREVQILAHLNTPRFVPHFYGACLESGRACLVMEYCPLGSLYDYLPDHLLTPEVRHHLALSLAQALQFLHQRKIIHCDLKSANILLVESDKLLEAKIADFGLSKAQYASIKSVVETSQAMAWCAPEILTGDKATDAADIYSYGMLLWEIMTGKCPIQSPLKNPISRERESCDGIPSGYASLITRCWATDPRERPQVADILKILNQITPGVMSPHAMSITQNVHSKELKYEVDVQIPTLVSMEISSETKVRTSPAPTIQSRASRQDPYRLAKEYHEKKDYVQARIHYEEALKEGNKSARNKLATLLMRGQGGPPDEKRGVALLKEAVADGDEAAMRNLSEAYKFGVGVNKDISMADVLQEQYEQKCREKSVKISGGCNSDQGKPEFQSHLSINISSSGVNLLKKPKPSQKKESVTSSTTKSVKLNTLSSSSSSASSNSSLLSSNNFSSNNLISSSSDSLQTVFNENRRASNKLPGESNTKSLNNGQN